MGKIGVAIVILITIIAIIGGLFAYSYTQLSLSLNDAEIHSIDFEELSLSVFLNLGLNVLSGNWFDAALGLIHGINLNLEFGLSNNGLLPVYIPDFSYELLINEIPIGNGNSKIDITIEPGQTKEIIPFQNIQKTSLSSVINSIVNTQGVIDIKVLHILNY